MSAATASTSYLQSKSWPSKGKPTIFVGRHVAVSQNQCPKCLASFWCHFNYPPKAANVNLPRPKAGAPPAPALTGQEKQTCQGRVRVGWPIECFLTHGCYRNEGKPKEKGLIAEGKTKPRRNKEATRAIRGEKRYLCHCCSRAMQGPLRHCQCVKHIWAV